MPRLPSSQDFTRDTPSSQRGIVGYQSGQEARAIGQLGQTVGAIGTMLEQEQEKLDNTRAEDAVNKAKQAALELSQGENGFSSVKGEGVVTKPIKEDYTQRFGRSMKEIEGTLSPKQIEIFRRRAQPTALGYKSTLYSHIAKETTAYQDQTDAATIDIELNAAAANWKDPQAVADARARISYTINSMAERHGDSKAEIKQAMGDQLTKMHMGIISSMAISDPEGSDAYYQKNKKEINRTERSKIEAHIHDKTVKGFSQRESDRIFSMDLTATEQLAAARKVKDPDKRAATVSAVKQRIAEETLARDDALEKANGIMKQTRNIDMLAENMSPDEYALITNADLVAFKSNARKLSEGDAPVHDPAVWNEFNELLIRAASPRQDVRKKALDDLRAPGYISDLSMSLDPTHADRAIAARKAVLTNTDVNKTITGATKVTTDNATINGYLNKLFDVKKNSERSKTENEFAIEFTKIAQSRLDEWAIENQNKTVPASVRDQIFTELAQGLTVEKGSWFGLADKEYDVTNIPPEHLNDIAADLRAANLPVNGRTLLSEYLEREKRGLLK